MLRASFTSIAPSIRNATEKLHRFWLAILSITTAGFHFVKEDIIHFIKQLSSITTRNIQQFELLYELFKEKIELTKL